MTHPARVWIFLAAATLTSGAISALRPLYNSHLGVLGLGSDVILTTTGALRSFSFLGAPLIGVVLDRLVGVRRGALTGVGVMLAGCFLAIVHAGPVFAVLSLVLVTVGEAFARVALLVMLADAHPPGSPGRASAFLLRHIGLNFSFLGLPALTALLFAGNGITVPALMSAATILGALTLLLLTPEQDDSAPEPARTSGFGLLVFSLLGFATSAVNVAVDGFTTARIDTATQTGSVAANFIQLLNPLVVVLLGLPVALTWMRAKPGAVGRLTALLAGAAFGVCALEAAVAYSSAQVGLPPAGTLATLQMLGATVEVLAWPLSTALVSSVAPVRWRASYLGLWVAITGIPFGLSATDKLGTGAPAIAVLGGLSLLCAAVVLGARAAIASFVASFAVSSPSAHHQARHF